VYHSTKAEATTGYKLKITIVSQQKLLCRNMRKSEVAILLVVSDEGRWRTGLFQDSPAWSNYLICWSV